MQERQIESFLAYVWALGIVPTTNTVSADRKSLDLDQDQAKLFDADAIKTEAELQLALSDPDTVAITLASDIITLENLIVNRDDTVELNLNGFKIASLSQNARVIDLQAGDLAILGLGSIVATGADATAIRVRGAMTADNVNYSHLMVGADVTLYAPNYYGLFVATNSNAAYGVTVDFYGSIIARDGLCIHGNINGHGDNLPHINIQDGAKIIADENDGSAICAFGDGIWEISAAELSGGTGINIKSGSINLRQTNVIATGDSNVSPENGAAIYIADTFAHHAKIQIFDGSYLSVQGYTFYEAVESSKVASLRSLEIYNGTFSGQLGVCFGIAPRGSELSATHIYGGKFSADISQYLAPEHHVRSDRSRHEYVVIDDTEPTQALDKVKQLELAKQELEELTEIAKRYTAPSYAGNELGEIQATVNKIIGNIKRSTKASEKLLASSDFTLLKIKNSTRRLEDHLGELHAIEDAMRSEISEAIDFSKLECERYTPDSFLDLSMAAADAEQLLANDFVTLVELQDMLGVIDAAKIMLEEADEYVAINDAEPALDLPPAIAQVAIAPEPTSTPEPETTSLPKVAPEPEPEPEPEPQPEAKIVSESASEPLPELPLQPAPKLFPPLPQPQADMDVKRILDSFVDTPEEDLDPIESAFAVDDLETEELSETQEFVNQLKVAELIAAPEIFATSETSSHDQTEIEELAKPEAAPAPAELTEQVTSGNLPAPETPVLTFVDPELVATKQSLRNLLNAISVLDPADYTTESFTILARTATMAGNLLAENSTHSTTTVLLSAFNSVTVAYERLMKKADAPTHAALEAVELNLRSMLDAVQDLAINDYEPSAVEQFGELQVAIVKAKAILARDLPSLNDIINVMNEIKLATSGLKGAAAQTQLESQSEAESEPQPESESEFKIQSQPTAQVVLNWDAFREALNDIRELNPNDYTAESYQKLLAVLENAKTMSSQINLTQEDVDEIVFELNLVMLALERPVPPHLSSVQEFAEPVATSRAPLSTSDVPQPGYSATAATPAIDLSTDDSITPSWLMSMMAGAYAGLATYRRSRLVAKKRKNFRSA